MWFSRRLLWYSFKRFSIFFCRTWKTMDPYLNTTLCKLFFHIHFFQLQISKTVKKRWTTSHQRRKQTCWLKPQTHQSRNVQIQNRNELPPSKIHINSITQAKAFHLHPSIFYLFLAHSHLCFRVFIHIFSQHTHSYMKTNKKRTFHMKNNSKA